jgi:hypothetical protein
MISSVQSNLQWFNRYVQLVQLLSQNQLDTTRPASDLRQYIARTSEEVSDPRRQAYAREQAAQEQVNGRFGQYIRGLDQYRNPFDRRIVELPSGYGAIWANTLGEYVLSDDPSFDPNLGTDRTWKRVPPNR